MTNFELIRKSILEIEYPVGEEDEIKLNINKLKAIYKQAVRCYFCPQVNKHYEPTIEEMLMWLLQEAEEC